MQLAAFSHGTLRQCLLQGVRGLLRSFSGFLKKLIVEVASAILPVLKLPTPDRLAVWKIRVPPTLQPAATLRWVIVLASKRLHQSIGADFKSSQLISSKTARHHT